MAQAAAARLTRPFMKIAWFGHVASARRNGKVSYSRAILNGLRQRDVQVIFFFQATQERDLVTPPSTRAVRIGALDLWNRATLSSPRAHRTIRNVLKQEHPQVAHLSLSFSNLDATIADLCHEQNIPVVGTWHMPFGPPVSLWGIAMDMVYRLYIPTFAKFDAVIVFSENQKRILTEHGVASTKLHVIPNSVDVETFTPGYPDYKQELGARLLISYVGRVDPEKNVNVLCDALMSLGLGPDHKLVIAGSGLSLKALQRKYADPRIIFRGHITETAELHRILRSSDIYVLPSSVEGLSLAMLEAMASGAALIVTDVGADGEAARGAGIVLDLENLAGQLPLALRQLIEFPKFRQELRKRARRRAVERYALQDNLDRLIQLYQLVQA